MTSLPADRKVVVFTAGGVRLALRLSQVREIVAVVGDGAEAPLRGGAVPTLPVAVVLGLPAAPARFAIVTEASPPLALRVESVQGIVDLAGAEFFLLPARTTLPEPAPFQGAVVAGGELALELAVGALGWVPIEPAPELAGPPAELDFPTGRELVFQRRERTYAVPLQLVMQVLEGARVFPVPLTPAAHRGLVYHGRAIHSVFDLPVLYGEPPGDTPRLALLVEAGATAIAVLADRVLAAGESPPGGVARPSWDLMLG